MLFLGPVIDQAGDGSGVDHTVRHRQQGLVVTVCINVVAKEGFGRLVDLFQHMYQKGIPGKTERIGKRDRFAFQVGDVLDFAVLGHDDVSLMIRQSHPLLSGQHLDLGKTAVVGIFTGGEKRNVCAAVQQQQGDFGVALPLDQDDRPVHVPTEKLGDGPGMHDGLLRQQHRGNRYPQGRSVRVDGGEDRRGVHFRKINIPVLVHKRAAPRAAQEQQRQDADNPQYFSVHNPSVPPGAFVPGQSLLCLFSLGVAIPCRFSVRSPDTARTIHRPD